ncbi:hypothetical protein ABT224_20115 [Streptomyces sp. NPDC001584]|uniref:hypothetical protein n=1 Tax=Streptomyces sp. NPDC001584 TaxID=3154521 RepID=UPI003324654C
MRHDRQSEAVLRRFAKELRRLHIQVGRPSLREIVESPQKAGVRPLTRSTVHEKLSGKSKPSLDFISAFHFVLVAHGDKRGRPAEPADRDFRRWKSLWRAMNTELADMQAMRRLSRHARADLRANPDLSALAHRAATAVVAELETLSRARDGEWSAQELLEEAARRSPRSAVALVGALRKAGHEDYLETYLGELATRWPHSSERRHLGPQARWSRYDGTIWMYVEALRARGWQSEANSLLLHALSSCSLNATVRILRTLRTQEAEGTWEQAVSTTAEREAGELAILIGYLGQSKQRDLADQILEARSLFEDVSLTADLIDALGECDLLAEAARLADTFIDQRARWPRDIATLARVLKRDKMHEHLAHLLRSAEQLTPTQLAVVEDALRQEDEPAWWSTEPREGDMEQWADQLAAVVERKLDGTSVGTGHTAREQ